MALSKKRRPVVIVTGRVIAREPKQAYTDKGVPTGEIARYDVTLFQDGHATPDVRFPRESGLRLPDDGEVVSLVVDCGESDEWGANFRALRYLSADDLGALSKTVTPAAAKAA